MVPPHPSGARPARVGAVLGLVGALLLALLVGAVAGHQYWPEQREPAGISELQGALTTATGMTPQELRGALDYQEYDGVDVEGWPPVRQVSLRVPLPHGDPLVVPLQKAGYRLSPEQEPECVSDIPEITGLICTYRKGNIAVAVQIEPGPNGPEGLRLLAASG